MLRRKWTLRAHGRQVVFIKRPIESAEHVIMKALLWALYLPFYPDMSVEISIGDRFKPDLVSLDDRGRPLFWAEAGEVHLHKMRSLLRRYRETHFALARRDARLDPLLEMVQGALGDMPRRAPVDLITFPSDSVGRFIDATGEVRVHHDAVEWVRLEGESPPAWHRPSD
ncbi:MAG TPA: hypothetical protein GX702_11640 [Chloroflexi bacterium]|nr:hypothetical protein [Chloroflexota bacterium]